jgi:hypothetical protein
MLFHFLATAYLIGRGCQLMSYILPVGLDQYRQYQERIKGVKSNYNRTTSVDKVKRAYLFSIQAILKEKTPSNHASFHEKEKLQRGKSAERVYAELTGIGGNFNECA